ncbi:hypothetical protein [Methanoculleus sediminis]|uniref:hypothetical protein n=1 Tax=Methanoculleus sediminis TaxID=1550566 RepID=UPI000AA337AC|nr:hypothetical protein [Methanoculleus sediminis]
MNDVYVFTDRNVYHIGDVVEFGIVNCGDEQVEFSNPSPWRIDKWVTNASGGTPGNNIGTWEIIGDAGCTPCARCYLNPGQNWTLYRTSAQERAAGDLKYSWTEERVRWNTTDWWDTAEASGSPVHPYEIRIHDDPLTPGKYRIWYGRNLAKEFELV